MFESRRKQSAHTAYRALLWALVVIVATVIYLDQSPMVLDSDVELAEGEPITREAESDVVVVLDYEAIRNSGPAFEQRDWSVAWINLFEQEIGPVSVATPRSLSSKTLEESRVVVLTSSVSGQIPASLLERLRQHTLDGNVLVVERPSGEVREAFSANGRAGERQAQQLTYARGLAEPYNAELLQMPLATQFVGSTAPRSGATTHLSVDGAPGIYAVPIGDGTAITVDFDLGEQLVSMQQGRPRFDYTVAASEPHGTPKTSELIMDEQLATTPIPYADLLERFVVHGVIGAYTALPTFWGFPGGAQGAVVALHEDSELGDGGGWMLEYETDNQAVSTLLTTIDSGLTASGAAIMHRTGGELGLAWKKAGTPLELTERVGLAGIEPIAQPLGLDEQLDALAETLPVNYIRTARVADSWWDTEWARPFELMAAQNLHVDTSYSPAPGSGYAFGTGFTFRVVGADGMPLGMRELPVVHPTGVTDGPAIGELIEQSAGGYHEAITWAVAPEIFADYPDMERFERWLEVFEVAERHGHIITSVNRFNLFRRSRRAGRIHSRVVERAEMPDGRSARKAAAQQDDSDEADAPTAKYATLLRVTVEAKRRGLSLTVPATLDGKRFQLARKGVNRIAGELVSGDIEAVPAQLVGYKMQRIPLDAGFNTIDVYYR